MAWDGTKQSDFLFDLLAEVEGRLNVLENMINIWSQASLDVSSYTKPRMVRAFLEVCRRTYWTRLWVIQESLSASSIEVLCGSKKLD
jgi:hypothetical protein